MTTTVYGIKTCSSTRKALKSLELQKAKAIYHDFRVEGVPPRTLKEWIGALGWEALLNKRSDTWRALAAEEKTNLDAARAEALMLKYPTLIKRPVIVKGGKITLGVPQV